MTHDTRLRELERRIRGGDRSVFVDYAVVLLHLDAAVLLPPSILAALDRKRGVLDRASFIALLLESVPEPGDTIEERLNKMRWQSWPGNPVSEGGAKA